MISATARDLTEQRLAAQDACISNDVFPIWMQHLPARDADGLRVSLEMVDKADIYIGIYAWRYGWIPDFDNPEELSITELELNRALQRKSAGKLREILIFIIDSSVAVLPEHFEAAEAAQQKLKALKTRASQRRVVGFFKSTADLRRQISEALADFQRREQNALQVDSHAVQARHVPASFCARPDYIPRFRFVGREDQLGILSNWAADDDATVLLFQAIGGSGKSALTWHWAKDDAGQFATRCRPPQSPWAGRFWYSFYERGANMVDFCQHAVAYMTGQPKAELEKRPFAALAEQLLDQLHARPWLLILDGIERVLVHYHQLDPSAEPDEAAESPADHILDKRQPTDAIRDEDNDLLIALAGAAPSKILVSTRLIPRVLLNHAGAGIPGVRRLELPGLDDADAEAFLRSCGEGGAEIRGASDRIRQYLRANCDNHPLTIGALGGLIVGYRRAPGDFTQWLDDPRAGGALDFGELRLEQRRNHILMAAFDDLPGPGRQILSILALLYGSVDYATIEALNPHLPPKPPGEPNQLTSRAAENAIRRWRESCRAAEQDLDKTLTDLTLNRGLLQYDGHSRLYELHPVVRSVVTRKLGVDERSRAGERILDHFTALPHDPYDQARGPSDLGIGLHIVRTLIKLGRLQDAADNYLGILCKPLLKFEQYTEVLAISRPFFPNGWFELPTVVHRSQACHLLADAAIAFDGIDNEDAATDCRVVKMIEAIHCKDWRDVAITLHWLASSKFHGGNKVARLKRLLTYSLEFAKLARYHLAIFRINRDLAQFHSIIGDYAEADLIWEQLRADEDFVGAATDPTMAADTEETYVTHMRNKGCLSEEMLAKAELMAERANYRGTLRSIRRLRGLWHLDRGEWALAATSLRQCLEMAHENRLSDDTAETALALAKHHVAPASVTSTEVMRLAELRKPHHRYLARLWQKLGDTDRAKHHACAAYEETWADGEPYVYRYALTRTIELLTDLNVPIPTLPPYNPLDDEPAPWEADVRAAIDELRAENPEAESDGPRRIH